MIEPRLQATQDGAILFDAARSAQADAAWFDGTWWRAQGRIVGSGGGRGQALFVDAPFGACVLRHYRRGGWMARLSGDAYLWTGAENTRSLREFRLLSQLCQLHLPVPKPVAARYVRHAGYYRADLITERLLGVHTLAHCVAQNTLHAPIAARVGACIADFHLHGVFHADLNAHNILLDVSHAWLVDFDRGRMREPAARWQLGNLARLKRSLLKLGAARDGALAFERDWWSALVTAYELKLLQSGMSLPTAPGRNG